MSDETTPASDTRVTAPAIAPLVDARRVRIARIVAIVADVLQIALFPIFMAGWASPLDDVVDVAVGVILVRLLGWHFAFLPSFIAEIVPGLDLIPTWTAAVFLATRGRNRRPIAGPGPSSRE